MMETANFVWPNDAPEHLVKTLDGFLNDKTTLPHAYLFVGNNRSEIMETFASKIMGKQFPNVDSLVFDAADSGIEGVRELTQMAALAPVGSDYKIILMRNMEMANTAMLNALLKNLEEPPVHAIFILQSTRSLLATVASRCQVLNLPKGKAQIDPDLEEVFQLLEKNRNSGTAERLSLINPLADLKDDLLPRLIELWIQKQTEELKTNPEKYKSVRASLEAIQGLRSNFNKKMVLQNFVMNL